MTITMNIAEQGQISNIAVEALKVHPKNARKEYDADSIRELADSIRAKGVLQNLTVVPDKDEEGTFFVVIGNRRLLAAREAGIETLPCVIKDMEESEQLISMITENMQRRGLSATEEAGAMQMCFADFGMDVEQLSSETGLSQTTVRHRLNVAKLDQNLLKDKENDSGFQLNLSDLAALEKIRSISKRNEVLKNARDSRDLASRALSISNEQKRDKNRSKLIALAERERIEPAPDDARNELYSNKWETVKSVSLDDTVPRSFDIKSDDENDSRKGKNDKLYYVIVWREFKIIRKAKRVKRELSEAEIKEREVRKARRQHKAIFKEMVAQMLEFFRGIAQGKIKDLRKRDLPQLMTMIWDVMMTKATDVSSHNVALALSEGDYWRHSAEERKEITDKAEELPMHLQMLAVVLLGSKSIELIDGNGYYFSFAGNIFIKVYDILAMYGFSFEEDQLAIMNGTHEVYVKREEEKTVIVDNQNKDASSDVLANIILELKEDADVA